VARGWESKSVEEQQSEARQDSTLREQLTPEQIEGRRKRDGLILSRKSIERRLESATNSTHKEMLERALADLNRQIDDLRD
jgi:hypothetical protein